MNLTTKACKKSSHLISPFQRLSQSRRLLDVFLKAPEALKELDYYYVNHNYVLLPSRAVMDNSSMSVSDDDSFAFKD